MLVGGIYEFRCTSADCGEVFNKYAEFDRPTRQLNCPECPSCGSSSDRSSASRRNAVIGPDERTVMWVGYVEGKDGVKRKVFKNPMDHRMEVPPELSRLGFQKVEYDSIQAVQRLEKEANIISERLHFDRGTSTKRLDGSDAEPRYR